jgi:predicted dehydrogenase
MTADPIRVGIIGVHPEKGWATAAHIPALRQLGQFRLSAISHHRLDIAREAAVKFGAKHAFDSAEALVTHPDVDLVVVAVKVTRHKELVLSALTAGKAVFCEWPLGMTLRDAVAMRDFALAKRVTTSIGLQTRATPAFAYLRDLVSEGLCRRGSLGQHDRLWHPLGRDTARSLHLHTRPRERCRHAQRTLRSFH